MTNKPNFKIRKIIIKPLVKYTSAYCQRPDTHKNEPNQTQFQGTFLYGHYLSFLCEPLCSLWQKKAKNGVVWDKVGSKKTLASATLIIPSIMV